MPFYISQCFLCDFEAILSFAEIFDYSCNVGDMGSIPGLGRYPEGTHGNPLQFSCLENTHGQKSLEGYIEFMGSADLTQLSTQHWKKHSFDWNIAGIKV